MGSYLAIILINAMGLYSAWVGDTEWWVVLTALTIVDVCVGYVIYDDLKDSEDKEEET